MKTKAIAWMLGMLAIVCIAMTGCQNKPQGGGAAVAAPPATNWSNFYPVGGSAPSVTVSAVVTQVASSQWCYSVESFSFDSGGTNFMPQTPWPGSPGLGFADTGSFTNIEVSAPGCTGTITTPGWSVVAGSQVTFAYSGTAAKSSLVQFCLSCDKTNGNVTIKVTDAKGNVTTIGPIAGPQ